MSKNKISFIIGFAHSGSSITARILNSQKNTINIGEVNNYLKLKNRNDFCSCGSLIKECIFWQSLDLEDKTLYIQIRDVFKRKTLKEKVQRNIDLYDKIAALFAHTNDGIEIIDNSKHSLRAGLLSIQLRKRFEVQVYRTKRPAKEMLVSFEKRTQNERKGKLAAKPFLFPFYYLFSKISSLFFNLIMFFYKIPIKNIDFQNLSLFLESKKDELDIEEIENGVFKIHDKENHSIGGSSSSLNSTLKL